MLPTATPTKMTALAMTFLVVPPTLPVTSESARLKTALDAPVKSAISVQHLHVLQSSGETLTITYELGCLILAESHHGEADDSDDGHSCHKVCADVEVIRLGGYPDRDETGYQSK